MLKRLFDLFFAVLGMIILSPFLLITAILIKIASPGPVFYRGERVGKNLKIFRIFKFRSMVVDAEKLGGPSTAGDDKRLTKIGKLLRKYKLDELPQLFNVIKGEMSFVGHRPDVKSYVDRLPEKERSLIFSIKPGITDWASLWDSQEEEVLRGSVDPDKAYDKKIWPTKIKLQLKYVRNRSFLTDLKIILQTIKKIFLSGKR